MPVCVRSSGTAAHQLPDVSSVVRGLFQTTLVCHLLKKNNSDILYKGHRCQPEEHLMAKGGGRGGKLG